MTDPDDRQKWPKGLTEEDGKLYRNGNLLVPESRVLELCEGRGVLRCAWCPVCGVVCAVSWASRPLFTGAHAAFVVLCGRCPGPLGSGGLFGVLCVVCGVLGHVAPVHRCACSVCCVVCAVWVWARARVRHTVAATLRTLRFCSHMARHRGQRRSELATGILATTASGFLWCLTYSSRPGLFGFGDFQE